MNRSARELNLALIRDGFAFNDASSIIRGDLRPHLLAQNLLRGLSPNVIGRETEDTFIRWVELSESEFVTRIGLQYVDQEDRVLSRVKDGFILFGE